MREVSRLSPTYYLKEIIDHILGRENLGEGQRLILVIEMVYPGYRDGFGTSRTLRWCTIRWALRKNIEEICTGTPSYSFLHKCVRKLPEAKGTDGMPMQSHRARKSPCSQ